MEHLTSDIRDRVPEFGEAVAVNGRGIAPKLNAAEGIYNGTPNAQDVERIRATIGAPVEADDWTVWSFNAFDTSVNLDFEVFSPSMVSQYADRIVGRSLLLNHDLGHVQSSQGVVIDAKVYQLDSVPEEARKDLPNFATSKEIAASAGGYYWVHAKAAVRANTPLAEGLANGSINRCSVGALTFDERLSCPDCSAEHERYVGFWEEEEVEASDGKESAISLQYVCPHTPLSWTYLMLNSYFGDPNDPPNWSKGVMRDAAVYPLELSACVHGMIGTCKVIRN